MHHPRTRRVQRIHLAQPQRARLGAAEVMLVDLSLTGAGIEHHTSLGVVAGARARLTFVWEDEEMAMDCRIVRSRLERFSSGAAALTVYHSGIEFENLRPDTKARLKGLISLFISRALEEQKLNARGVIPQHDVSQMPIFRHGGQLTANSKDLKAAIGETSLPSLRVAKESGYICYQLERDSWRHKKTQDPGQPKEGFTISALEDLEQVELLCDAYRRLDAEGRRMIRLFAQLSIMDGEGIAPGRFEP